MYNMDIISRGLDILTRVGSLTSDDASFLRNHIKHLVDFTIDHATHDLVRHGVDEELARNMLGVIRGISEMAGASSFADFAQVAEAISEAGLDNA